MLRAAQAISLAGHFEQPVVDAGPAAGGRYGANLFVGAVAELAGKVDLSRARADRRAARLRAAGGARPARQHCRDGRNLRAGRRGDPPPARLACAAGLAAGAARRRRLPRLSSRRRPQGEAARSRRRQRGVHRPSLSRRLQHRHAAGFLCGGLWQCAAAPRRRLCGRARLQCADRRQGRRAHGGQPQSAEGFGRGVSRQSAAAAARLSEARPQSHRDRGACADQPGRRLRSARLAARGQALPAFSTRRRSSCRRSRASRECPIWR